MPYSALNFSKSSPVLTWCPTTARTSATRPGRSAYNVVSIEQDGRLGRVTGILKEIGAGPHPLQTAALPSAVIFDRQGRVLTADFGSDKLSVLALSNGELSVTKRYEVHAGSGPARVVLHPDANRAYVAHALDGSLSSFDCDTTGALRHRETVRSSVPASLSTSTFAEAPALAMHPSGKALYSSHGSGVQTWKADGEGLRALHQIGGVRARSLQVTADGAGLFALSRNSVVMMSIDAAQHTPCQPLEVATLLRPLSMAIV